MFPPTAYLPTLGIVNLELGLRSHGLQQPEEGDRAGVEGVGGE